MKFIVPTSSVRHCFIMESGPDVDHQPGEWRKGYCSSFASSVDFILGVLMPNELSIKRDG